MVALFCELALGQMRTLQPLPGGGGKTDARVAAAAAALAARPGDARLSNELALAYIQKMRETVDFSYLNRASKLVDSVLEHDPGNYEGLRLRSEIAMERHEFALVAEYSEETTRFAPNDPGAWGSLGDALMELGEYQRAGEAYAKMLALRPDLASYNRVAWHRFVTGDASGAIATMRAAIASRSPAPENVAWCLADLGGILWKLGKEAEASTAYREALVAFPGYFPAYAGLGRIASATNHPREAAEFFLKAQAAAPMPEFAEALEDLYTRMGNARAALNQRQLIDAIESTMRAGGEKTNRNMALLFANQNRNLDRARELVANEIKVRPDIYTFDALAWVLFRQGQFEAAQTASQKALALATPEPAFHFHAAMIAQALGQNDRAGAEFQKALALNPNFDFHQASVAREMVSGRAMGGY